MPPNLRWLFFAAGPLEAAVINTQLGVNVTAAQEIAVGYGNLTLVLDALETAIRDTPYICGETFTAADVYVTSQISSMLQIGTPDMRPSFEAYVARAGDRDAAKRATRINDSLTR